MLQRWLKKREQVVPAPITVPASQTFDGNDGPWSSFPIQIGTPPQTVKVLPSTKGSQTWAVLPQGCISSDPANCTTARGGIYQPNSSSTWNQNQGASGGLFPLLLETNLDATGNGLYGYDTVALGGQGNNGPSLAQQVVAGIATKAFYLGIFGLSPKAVTLPETNNQLPTYLSALNNSNLIPSLSWSYTAGNQYRPGPVYGSLILGGQDTSRFAPNNITFPFNDAKNDLPDLVVNIGTIFLTLAGQSTTLQSDNATIQASVDSTTPYIWLPSYVCQHFEEAFGIVWDSAVQGYLVNETLHRNLSSSDASVVFNLGNASTVPGQGFNISLPYSAFDLVAGPPLVKNPSRYFPLMRAANGTQITLGRTFLQEAYITADYERKNFSISQCTWPNPRQQAHIIPINRPSSAPPPSPHHLSGGAIAGIVIGALLGTALILTLLCGLHQLRRRHRRRRSLLHPDQQHQPPRHHPTKPTHIDLPTSAVEIDSPNKDPYFYSPHTHTHSPELDAVVHKGHELDSGIVSPTTLEMAAGEAQDHPVELDASAEQQQLQQKRRSSRILRSFRTISGGSVGRNNDGRPRLHQREGSEGMVSVESPTTAEMAATPTSPVSGENKEVMQQGRQEPDHAAAAAEMAMSPLSPVSDRNEGARQQTRQEPHHHVTAAAAAAEEKEKEEMPLSPLSPVSGGGSGVAPTEK